MPPHRRLSDLLEAAEFLLVQLVMLHRTGGPHLIRERGARLALLHRKLDNVERELRWQALDLGIEDGLTMGALRRRLAQYTERRHHSGPDDGAEQRRGQPRRISTKKL